MMIINIEKTKRDSLYILERLDEPQNQEVLADYVRPILGNALTTEEVTTKMRDIVSLYKKCRDKAMVAEMFKLTTSTDFEDFLDMCVRLLTPVFSHTAQWGPTSIFSLFAADGVTPITMVKKSCQGCGHEHMFILGTPNADRMCPRCGALMTGGNQ